MVYRIDILIGDSQHIKIVLYFKKLCYKKSGTQTRKADLETSRLFYERF